MTEVNASANVSHMHAYHHVHTTAHSSSSSSSLNATLELIDKHGLEQVANAMHNDQVKKYVDDVKQQIMDSDMPQFMKDDAIAMLDKQMAAVMKPTSTDCGCDVEATPGPHNTKPPEGAGGSEPDKPSHAEGGGGGGGATAPAVPDDEQEKKGRAGNWLEALAMGLAQAQLKFLHKAMDEMNIMKKESAGAASGENKEQSTKFVTAQAKYQVANQMFSMMANMTSTSLKTIGEGLNSIARKQ